MSHAPTPRRVQVKSSSTCPSRKFDLEGGRRRATVGNRVENVDMQVESVYVNACVCVCVRVCVFV